MTAKSPLYSIVTQITVYPTVSRVLLLSMLMTGQNFLSIAGQILQFITNMSFPILQYQPLKLIEHC